MNSVLIRPLRIEDAKISFKWRNDTEIWKFTGRSHNNLITEEIETNWLFEKLNLLNSTYFAIISDNQYIGNIQITDIIESEKGQYHIFIGEKLFWGKGIAKLATAQIIRFAKEKLNLKELYLVVKPEHLTAIKLYENCGFIKVDNEIKMSLKLQNSKLPIVSVFVMTYNHAQFIKQTLEGILMQKTNFDFDIVVGDDCSTDTTRNILQEYSETYPGKFKLLLHEHNIGAIANQISVFKACKGKYIALCEGDDYWVDPDKLQNQVDFLESNEDFGLVHTDYNILIENEKGIQEIKSYHSTSNKLISLGKVQKALIRYNFIATVTVVTRKCFIDEYLVEFPIKKIFSYKQGDYPLWLFIAGKTKISYINTATSSYRVRESSLSHSNQKMKNIAFMLSEYKIKLDFIFIYRIFDLKLYWDILKKFPIRLWDRLN